MNTPSNDPSPEKDFWDLGDDDLDSLEDQTALEQPTTPATEEMEILVAKKADAEKMPAAPIAVEKAEVKFTEPAPTQSPSPTPAPAVAEKKPTTLIEKASLAIVFLGLLGAAAWGVSNYYSQAPEGNFIELIEDFPVSGNAVTVEESSSWWRKPIRTGPNADRGIQLNARLIPCVKLRLSGDGNATLRYAFRDSDNRIVGDSPTLNVINGKFEQNGSEEIILNCSGGFTNASLINPYVNQDIKPWIFQLLEAPLGETPDQNSEPFIKSAIDALYQETEQPSES